MAALSTLDAAACDALRSRLEEIVGVAHATVDADAMVVWLICDPDADRDQLEADVREELRAKGTDDQDVEIRLAVEAPGTLRRRIRFDGVERLDSETGTSRVRVRLSWQGSESVGEATGEAGRAIELRTAAAAALNALEAVVGRAGEFRLIGVKRMRAFDAEMIVVSVHRRGGRVQRLVGAALASPDPVQGAALAVLQALNRVLGNVLATTD